MNHRQRVAFMAQAYMLAGLSYAPDRRVGAYILKELPDGTQQIVSTGYNGTRPGQDNNTVDENGVTKPSVRHAERNAIHKAAKSTVSTEGCTLLVTVSPCADCADWIIGTGIKEVIFCEAFVKDLSGLDDLYDENVTVHRVDLAEVLKYIEERTTSIKAMAYRDSISYAVGKDSFGIISDVYVESQDKESDTIELGIQFESFLNQNAPSHIKVTGLNGTPVLECRSYGELNYRMQFSLENGIKIFKEFNRATDCSL